MQMCEVEPTTSQLSKDDSSDKMKRKKKNFEMDGFIISSCIMAQHFILFSLANTLCSWPVINWKLSIRISRDEQRIPFMIVRLFRSLTLAQTQTFFLSRSRFSVRLIFLFIFISRSTLHFTWTTTTRINRLHSHTMTTIVECVNEISPMNSVACAVIGWCRCFAKYWSLRIQLESLEIDSSTKRWKRPTL